MGSEVIIGLSIIGAGVVLGYTLGWRSIRDPSISETGKGLERVVETTIRFLEQVQPPSILSIVRPSYGGASILDKPGVVTALGEVKQRGVHVVDVTDPYGKVLRVADESNSIRYSPNCGEFLWLKDVPTTCEQFHTLAADLFFKKKSYVMRELT